MMHLFSWMEALILLRGFKNSRLGLVKSMDQRKKYIGLQFLKKIWYRLIYIIKTQNRLIPWGKLHLLIWKNKNLLIFIWENSIKRMKINKKSLTIIIFIQFTLVQRHSLLHLIGVNIQEYLPKLRAKVCVVHAGHFRLFLKLNHILLQGREFWT
jgi:hypothetical protein